MAKSSRASQVQQQLGKLSCGAVLRVAKESDTVQWHRSQAYHELLAYIGRTSSAIQGVRQSVTSGGYAVSAAMQRLCAIFDSLGQLAKTQPGRVAKHPLPYQGAKRMSVVEAYRSWSRAMHRIVFRLVEQALSHHHCEHVGELGQYLANSFGNPTRLDYGSGHELSFLFFLCSLFRIGALLPSDEPAAALLLFQRYLRCVRRLQLQFGLSSAGYHGAYSLDDFQFVAYLWGAAQLCHAAPFQPKQLLLPETRALWRHDYLLAGCAEFVGKWKAGSFASHSCQLWSVATLSSWTQVYRGLHNMYLTEVLNQFPMLRHLHFGQLMSYDPAPSVIQLARPQLGALTPQPETAVQLESESEWEILEQRTRSALVTDESGSRSSGVSISLCTITKRSRLGSRCHMSGR